MEKLDNRSGVGGGACLESRSSSSLNSHPIGKIKLKWELASADVHPNGGNGNGAQNS